MIRQTIQIGHPSLKAENNRIVDFDSIEIKELITDLIDTMHEAQLIGIAAPQIARNFQVFVTEPRETPSRPADQADQLRIFISPQIITSSKEESIIYEGCGSVLNGQLYGPVKRPKIITIQAYDEKGRKFLFSADGILGRVIQHEYDHLQGIEFTEKITNYKKLLYIDFYKTKIKNSKEQIEASKITVKECQFID